MVSFKAMQGQASYVTADLDEKVQSMAENVDNLSQCFDILESALQEFNDAAETVNSERDALKESATEYVSFVSKNTKAGLSEEVKEFFDSIPNDEHSSWTTDSSDCEVFRDEMNNGWIENAENVDFDIVVQEPEVDSAILSEVLERVSKGLDALVDLGSLESEFPSSELIQRAYESLVHLTRDCVVEPANKINAFISEISSESIDEGESIIGDFDVNGD